MLVFRGAYPGEDYSFPGICSQLSVRSHVLERLGAGREKNDEKRLVAKDLTL